MAKLLNEKWYTTSCCAASTVVVGVADVVGAAVELVIVVDVVESVLGDVVVLAATVVDVDVLAVDDVDA